MSDKAVVKAVAPVPREKDKILQTLDFLATKYQPPGYDALFREVKKGTQPNLTKQFPRLLRSAHGVIDAYDDIGKIITTSAGPQCGYLELARMTRDSSFLLTLFLEKLSHCTHKPPRNILGYFSDVNGSPSQFLVRAVMFQFLVTPSGDIELAVMLIGDHPDLLTDLAHPNSHLDARTIAQGFSQLIIHPSGELNVYNYKPMDIALPRETFLRELQGAPLLPPREKLYLPNHTRVPHESMNPSMFLNQRVQMERVPMKLHELEDFVRLLCSYFDEVADCLVNHY